LGPEYKYLANTGYVSTSALGFSIRGRRSFVFDFKGSRDAILRLYQHPKNNVWYDVVLGGWANAQSKLLPSDKSVERCIIHNILSSSAYKTFWVAWDGGMLRTGPGSVPGVDTYMTLPITFDLNYLRVTSNDVTTYWIFHRGKTWFLFSL
jgi:hypothetical protein